MVLGVEELRGLKGFQYTATLLDLERLRFVGTCCLRLLRVYICEIFPIAGRNTKHFISDSMMTDRWTTSKSFFATTKESYSNCYYTLNK